MTRRLWTLEIPHETTIDFPVAITLDGKTTVIEARAKVGDESDGYTLMRNADGSLRAPFLLGSPRPGISEGHLVSRERPGTPFPASFVHDRGAIPDDEPDVPNATKVLYGGIGFGLALLVI